MEVLTNAFMTRWILPPLPARPGGRRSAAAPAGVVGAICYQLKPGCPWRWRPVQAWFAGPSWSWPGVDHRFQAWGKQGAGKRWWVLCWRRRALDLSGVPLDGRHTPAQNGGAASGYPGRKAARAPNARLLADHAGRPRAVATPRAGTQHDPFAWARVLAGWCAGLEAAGLRRAGLFPNADQAVAVRGLRPAGARRGIGANVPRNRRSADWPTDDDPH